MSGKRKRPTLRKYGKYFVTVVYKPNGVRSNVSFGSEEERSETEINIAFQRWIDLFLIVPHSKCS